MSLQRLARALGCGALTGTALVGAAPPCGLYPLAVVAFVPLLRAADDPRGGVVRPVAAAALAGWTAGAVFYIGVADWLPATIARLQGIGAVAAWFLFGVFVAAHALQFGIASAAAAWLSHGAGRPRVGWFATASGTASLWVVLEWGMPRVFPWSVGNLFGPAPRLRQVAALGGVHALALLIMLVGALLAESADWRRPPEQRIRSTAAAVALLTLAWTYGGFARQSAIPLRQASSLEGAAPATKGRAMRFAILQGGTSAGAADLRMAAEAAFAAYAELTRAAAPAADVLVWPESSLRVYLRDNDVFARRLAALARAAGRPLLLGALDRTTAGAELNAAYLFAPAAGAPRAAIYHKTALLPFGEYVPGADWWPLLRRWRTTGEFVRGPPGAPLDVDLSTTRLRLAPSICFEAVRAGAFNDMVRDGAVLLVNLTDDGWFASANAAAQHLELTRLRAVETRRWLVRASGSGISAFVDPAGDIVASLPLGAVGALVRSVEPRHAMTPYVRWGDSIVFLCAAVAGAQALRRLDVTARVA